MVESSPRTILIVDDDERLLAALASSVTSSFARVETATTGREAIKRLTGWIPDVLLLDVVLPDGSAFDVLRTVRTLAPAPLVLAMSGQATPVDAFRLAQMGVAGYLEKPFDLSALHEAIERAQADVPDLDPHLRRLVGKLPMRELESDVRTTMLQEALARTGGSRRSTARLLDVSRQLVQHMIRKKSES